MLAGMSENIDRQTVASFGEEWSRFSQSEAELAAADRLAMFEAYFHIFPWEELPAGAVGADIGCGSGRWAALVAPRVGHLYVVDPSAKALDVARANLRSLGNITPVEAAADDLPLADGSLDFAYCLGVLHHVPDPLAALRSIAGKLKPEAPLLVYIYYALDDRGPLYRAIWRITDLVRIVLSRAPTGLQRVAAGLIAHAVYWPVARGAALLERWGRLPRSWPLAYYRQRSLYVMRTDAYDRFCTPLEQRFRRDEIAAMLTRCGFEDVRFSPEMPFWCALARKCR